MTQLSENMSNALSLELSPELRLIHKNDTMLDTHGDDRYFYIGKSALVLCKQFLREKTPSRILDFPSGYGRVTRWLRAEWPNAEISAVELYPDMLDFTHSQFGAIPIQASTDLNFSIPSNNDLIFCGSLLTHFDEWQWDKFLAMTVSSLSKDGVLIFTTHGRVAALNGRRKDGFFKDSGIDTPACYREYKKTGFSFKPYHPDYPTYGLTFSSPEWIMRKLQALPEARIIGFEEQGWGQDVVVLVRNPWPMVADD